MRLSCFVLCATTLVGLPVMAEEYRLVPGDRVTIDYDFLETSRTTVIDIDGNIRLPTLGSIVAIGKSLDEVEAQIAQAMVNGGFSGEPAVSVEVSEYAQVAVSGFVERSGLYNYAPGMNVGVALAIAGGARDGVSNSIGFELSSLAARKRMLAASEQITSVVARIARLEAGLAGPETEVVVSEALRSLVAEEEVPKLESYRAQEAEILGAERLTATTLIASWDKEIEDNREQIDLLEKRIVLGNDFVAQVTQELEASRDLQSRGLTTNTQTSNLVQRLATEREDVLALETAKVVARRARSVAERDRAKFGSDQYRIRIEALQEARNQLGTMQRDFRFAQAELAFLNGDASSQPTTDDWFGMTFEILGPRADRVAGQIIDRETMLLPGDILVVTVDLKE